MDLNGLIGFNVVFDFTNVPTLVLQPTTSIPDTDKPNLIGHFVITQPDGITTAGSFGSINWVGGGFCNYSETLRLSNDFTYQKGSYSIIFFAQCAGYTYSQISRSWDMEYKPVLQTITSQLDCFTPSLKYQDNTIYGIGGYNIASQSSRWGSTCSVGSASSVSSILDLSISGVYYDSIYKVAYTKVISYQHSSYSWLSVNEQKNYRVTEGTYIPPSMKVMISYLGNLQTAKDSAKNNCVRYNYLDNEFRKASELFQLIKAKSCTSDISNLIILFIEFYNLTHNYTPLIYVNTNLIIPVYDLASWCDSSGSNSGTGSYTVFYSALSDGEFTCPFTIPNNARIDFVVNEIQTLRPSQYSWTGSNIALLGGIQLSKGQTVEVHYVINTNGRGSYTVFYSALLDGETTCPFTIPNNARIDYVKKEIKTLQTSQYTWTGTNIVLTGGAQLASGETIEVHYIL